MRKQPKLNKTKQGGMGLYPKSSAPDKAGKPAPKKGKK